ncbi:MAG: hypothetical protein QF577_00485 [Phycisphaerae bacterium]|jgi:hypothetical protein|nr:hypothetical protein [Phycisphaerae bacterium]MDP7636003.1 hypothetical protein [Phycisphaerae bacterium]
MRSSLPEAVGFLCRWSLLALAGAVVLVTSWAGLLAAAVADDLHAGLILPDALWHAKAKNPYLTGFLGPSAQRVTVSMTMHQDHFGRLHLTRTYGRSIQPHLPTPPIGTHTVIVRGLPYSTLAFQQYQGRLVVVPDPQEVYLVDARLAADSSQGDQAAMDRVLAHLKRIGQPALFCPHDPGQFVRLRKRLARYRDIPMLCATTRYGKVDLMTTIWDTSLRKLQRKNRKPFVITGDTELAILAAQQRHYTHLVAPKGAIPNRTNLRPHDSLGHLADHLAKEHSTHQPIR